MSDLLRSLLGKEEDGQGSQEVPAEVQDAPMFPLDKEVMLEVAQPVSAAAVVVLSTCLVLAGTGLDEKTESHVLMALKHILFAYIPIGLAGLLISSAAKKRTGLVGIASGFLLLDFMIPVIVGAVVTVVKSGEDAWVVSGVAGGILAFIVLAWSQFCAYPKFLRCGRDRVNPSDYNAEIPDSYTGECPKCGGHMDPSKGKSPVQEGNANQCTVCARPVDV